MRAPPGAQILVPTVGQTSARAPFPPADEDQRHVPGALCPPPVTQHPAIPNVGQVAPIHPPTPDLNTEAIATLMNQVRDGFTTLQAMPSSTHSARVTGAVMASLQEGFQNFVSTVVRQRELDWQTAMDEHNKRVQEAALTWQRSLLKMDVQSMRTIHERDRRITDLEKQIEKLKNDSADSRNQLLGLQLGMEQPRQEYLTENNRLTTNGSLGDTPESVSQNTLRSRGLLPPDQENRQSDFRHVNQQPVLPKLQYVSTSASNARLAAMDEGLETDDDDHDDDDEPDAQERSKTSEEPGERGKSNGPGCDHGGGQ